MKGLLHSHILKFETIEILISHGVTYNCVGFHEKQSSDCLMLGQGGGAAGLIVTNNIIMLVMVIRCCMLSITNCQWNKTIICRMIVLFL